MKKIRSVALAFVAGALVLLVAASCAKEPAHTIRPGAKVGISLPSAASENWLEAGGTLKSAIAAAGFAPDLHFASETNAIYSQKKQISALIRAAVPVIVVAAVDPRALGDQLEAASDAGITIIALDRNLAPASDDARSQASYFIGYNQYAVGQLQGGALLAGLRAEKGKAPYNVELFAGDVDDADSRLLFDGAMSILRPHIAAKTLVVRSGNTSFASTTTPGGLTKNVVDRMSVLLATHPTIDGILAPNDTIAAAVVKSTANGRPVTTGSGSTASTIQLLVGSRLHSTIYSSRAAEAAAASVLLTALSLHKNPAVRAQKLSGVTAPFIALTPITVTTKNALNAFSDSRLLDNAMAREADAAALAGH